MGKSGLAGGLMFSSNDSRARMFWQRADTSRRVPSSFERPARDLAMDAEEDWSAVWR